MSQGLDDVFKFIVSRQGFIMSSKKIMCFYPFRIAILDPTNYAEKESYLLADIKQLTADAGSETGFSIARFSSAKIEAYSCSHRQDLMFVFNRLHDRVRHGAYNPASVFCVRKLKLNSICGEHIFQPHSPLYGDLSQPDVSFRTTHAILSVRSITLERLHPVDR